MEVEVRKVSVEDTPSGIEMTTNLQHLSGFRTEEVRPNGP